jgi:hypothetical protein
MGHSTSQTSSNSKVDRSCNNNSRHNNSSSHNSRYSRRHV